MNVRKLRKLKRYILAEPRRYRQNTWLERGPMSSAVRDQQPPCGTVGCIAGNVCLMEGYVLDKAPQETVHKKGERRHFEISDVAQKILGLSDRQAANLFSYATDGWSHRASQLYFESGTVEGRAQAAAMAIDDLIATNTKKRPVTKSKH